MEPEPAHRQARNRVSHHSRSAWRIVIAKIGGRSFQLWRTRIVWRAQLAAQRHERRDLGDSLPYIETVRNELVGIDGRRRGSNFRSRRFQQKPCATGGPFRSLGSAPSRVPALFGDTI